MDRLQAMTVLLAVADAGSLSAASRRLKIPLATVSRRVGELEAHVGAKLVNRTSRSLDLTDAGRDYIAAARRILDDVAEAERAAAGEYAAPKGDLIITAPLAFPVWEKALGFLPMSCSHSSWVTSYLPR